MYTIVTNGASNMVSNESKLSNAVASLSMEGLYVTEDEIRLARKCLSHEITYDEAIRHLIEKHYVDMC